MGLDDNGNNKYLVLEPYIEEGQLFWSCYGENIQNHLLPRNCQ